MKKLVLLSFVLALLLITVQLAYTYSGSAPPSAMTNAPGNSNCTSCHSSTLATSGTLWNGITLTTTVPLTSLLPNTVYTLNLTFSDPSSDKYGFQLVALPSGATAATASVGTLTATGLQTEVNVQTGRQYMSHSALGTSAPAFTKTWTFNYTTPTAFTGGINFYVVVNSTDNDGTFGGDQIFAKIFASTVMPVKWLSYGLTPTDNGFHIKWATACEVDNSHFEIEKSSDALSWEVIAKVKSKGNTNATTHYSYTDESESTANSFYRIKQVDFNGRFEYSKILSSQKEGSEEYVTYDATQRLIQVHNATQMASTTLFSLSGKPVATSEDGTDINVSSLERGIYLLQLPSGNYQKIFIY
ncbi:MAG: choice-of-anchor V domain-containing protein [Bacteroidota bacterium]